MGDSLNHMQSSLVIKKKEIVQYRESISLAANCIDLLSVSSSAAAASSTYHCLEIRSAPCVVLYPEPMECLEIWPTLL